MAPKADQRVTRRADRKYKRRRLEITRRAKNRPFVGSKNLRGR